ncbi:MAG TPA: hypothetical protein ENN19_14800 [Chloroflexi bacterium]|nr:hypothetical protein [Chloroflexota bacterium]
MNEASETPRQALERSRQATIKAFRQVDDSTLVRLTRLTLPEIRAIQREVAQVLPAGNLPAFVLSGLVKLKGRRVSGEQAQRDVATLLRGISLLPQSLYGVFVAGPAAVLYAYQKLLQLSGKDLDSAFPQGTWQFYLQFGLREDTARHACETLGFHRDISTSADPLLEASAWLCAALEMLYSYDDLLAVDWCERVTLRLVLEEAARAEIGRRSPFATLIQDWNQARPYHGPPDDVDYFAHRRRVFQDFLREPLDTLPQAAREHFRRRRQACFAEELPAYQEQMSILAALVPDRYHEQKAPIPLWRAAVAFVWQGRTYLLPACQRDEKGSPLCYPSPGDETPVPLYALPDGTLCTADHCPLVVDRSGHVYCQEDGRRLGDLCPPTPEMVRGWVAAVFSARDLGPAPGLDLLLVESPRSLQPRLREQLPEATRAELDALRRAPIFLNWDVQSRQQPLAHIRRARRGIGDHALTIFRTDRGVVFDQSHVFFDGMWGMAVAEVMTGRAMCWRHRLLGQPKPPVLGMPVPLALNVTPEFESLAQAECYPGEAAAESGGVDMKALACLRRWLRQRGASLTVNDVLILYRFFHARWYRPSQEVRQAVADFGRRANTPAAREALQSIEETWARFQETNPALLIPMDASNISPRERVFPTTFRNPLTEIEQKYAAAQARHQAYRNSSSPGDWDAFDRARRELLAYLKAFGELLDALKAVTMRGESFNTASIRLLAHLPNSMQHLLDQVPQRIGILNEVLKGNEVFSNGGRVAPGSSLTRFISAKDDGETKALVWGVLTDDQDRMQISLRDFRPFVPPLLALGERTLVDLLAEDYLQSYVRGFNRFVADLGVLVAQEA